MSEAKSRSDERLSGPIAGCPDAKREDGQRSDEVNRDVVRAEPCPMCRGRGAYYNGLTSSDARCPMCGGTGRRAERVPERSGPDNPTAHGLRSNTVQPVVGHSNSGGGRE